MESYPKIATYPPLGQLTVIPLTQDHVSFTTIVEWDLAQPAHPFELLLAFTAAGSDRRESQWETVPLNKATKGEPNILDPEYCQRAIYTVKLNLQDFELQARSPKSALISHYLFTIAFRQSDQASWQWVSAVESVTPGELIFQQELQTSADDFSVLNNLELTSDWKVTPTDGGSGACPTSTFILESKAPIKNVEEYDLAVLPLATIPSAVRYFSVVRHKPYWLGPRQCKGNLYDISEDAIVVSSLLNNGLVVTFVVVGWIDDVYQVFQSDTQGRITVAAQNDNSEDNYYKVVLSIGYDFQATVASAMDQVRRIVTASNKIASLNETTQNAMSSMNHHAAKESTEQWLDSLAFCTWNGIGQDLTEAKLLNALSELQKHNINISTLLIDDNWQVLGPAHRDYSEFFFRGLSDIEANTHIAPRGFKDLITSIRTAHPSIKDIGVWHALMGYWGGLSLQGSIAKQYPTVTTPNVLMEHIPGVMTTIAPSHLHAFYSDFYSYLHDAGLTFIKTDVQHMLSTIQSGPARKSMISTYQSAWTAAQLKYFNGKAISCMAQTPQTLFHNLLNPSTPPIVLRNSDDFFPEIPESHPWHVWTNAHNAVFTRHLNVVLDWDMFQTDHEYSAFHAAARCVSGGPILITDVPGRHNVGLIQEMTATAPDGRTITLRTGPGETVDVFGLYEDGNMLKVRAKTSSAGTVMALFNVGEKDLRSFIHINDFGSLGDDTTEFLVRGHRTSDIFAPIALNSSTAVDDDSFSEHEARMKQMIHVRLSVRGWDILTMQPIQRVKHPSGRFIKVCVLGLLGKMSGAAAITSSSTSVRDKKVQIQITLKALGRLGVWFDSADAKGKLEVRVQGLTVEDSCLKLITLPENQGERGNVSTSNACIEADTAADEVIQLPHIWEINVETFWKRSRLWDEKCNSVLVELLVG